MENVVCFEAIHSSVCTMLTGKAVLFNSLSIPLEATIRSDLDEILLYPRGKLCEAAAEMFTNILSNKMELHIAF